MKVTQKPSLHASWIDPDAIDVVRRLQEKKFETYLVGGCVRDLLCNIHPKDFDIATTARPNEVRRYVYGSYVIGKRFRLVLVKRGNQQFEVATFRRAGRAEDFIVDASDEASDQEVMPSGDNFFGTAEEDAIRRDFTINGLFFDPIKGDLIDYCSGMEDIKNRILRMIGDPLERVKEDPIRSLRALRLAHKLKFQIEPTLRGAILDSAALVASTVLPRRREEYLKFLKLPDPAAAFTELWDLGLLEQCLPGLSAIFRDPQKQEVFLHYLRHLPDFNLRDGQTIEIYLPFLMGYRAACGEDLPTEEEQEKFFRFELGIFKGEYADIQETLHLKDRLQEVDLFRRRGHRRQQAFMKHPNLRLALKIGQFEKDLRPSDVAFWMERLSHIES